MNKEVLVALRTNFDRPEHMKEWAKRLQRKIFIVWRSYTRNLIYILFKL